jgi:hypothetical protein
MWGSLCSGFGIRRTSGAAACIRVWGLYINIYTYIYIYIYREAGHEGREAGPKTEMGPLAVLAHVSPPPGPAFDPSAVLSPPK